MLIVVLLAAGCSGTYGKYKRQTRSESKETKQQLIENWSDYDIWLHYHTGYIPPRLTIFIFDRKNDDKKILVGSNWSKVKDQEMWTEIVKENTTSDGGELTLVLENYGSYIFTHVNEIWGSENQLYGFILYQEHAVVLERVKMVDESTIRLSWHPPRGW